MDLEKQTTRNSIANGKASTTTVKASTPSSTTDSTPSSNNLTGDLDLNALISQDALKGNVSWTTDDNTFLRIYTNKSKFYQALYLDANYYYSRWEMAMTIPIAFFGIASIILQILSSVYVTDPNVESIVTIISVVLTGVSGIIISIQKYFNCSVTASKCESLYQNFGNFYQKLTLLETIPTTKRTNPYSAMITIQEKFQEIKDSVVNNTIPDRLVNQVIQRYLATGSPLNDIQDEFITFSSERNSSIQKHLKLSIKN